MGRNASTLRVRPQPTHMSSPLMGETSSPYLYMWGDSLSLSLSLSTLHFVLSLCPNNQQRVNVRQAVLQAMDQTCPSVHFPNMQPPHDTRYLPIASLSGRAGCSSIPFLVPMRGILQATSTSPPLRSVRSLVHPARQPALRRCWRVLALTSRFQPAPQSLRRRSPRLRRLSRFGLPVRAVTCARHPLASLL